jgi:predicted transcriptional regulator
MEIHFTPEQEAQISEGALLSGKATEQLVRDASLRFVQDQEAEFLAAVDAGIADADAGNFVDHEAVWAKVQKAICK